jgi:hypothetical protein
MSKLKPEYEQAAKVVTRAWLGGHIDELAMQVAIECQSLADRPPKMLSDDEVQNIFHMLPGGVDGFLREYGYLKFADMLQHAFIAKQSEPDTVPFDYEKWNAGNWQALELSKDGETWTTVSEIRAGYAYKMYGVEK